MCLRIVDVHVSCISHVDLQFAAFFIDPRAEWSTVQGCDWSEQTALWLVGINWLCSAGPWKGPPIALLRCLVGSLKRAAQLCPSVLLCMIYKPQHRGGLGPIWAFAPQIINFFSLRNWLSHVLSWNCTESDDSLPLLEGPESGPYPVYTVVSTFHKTMAMDIKLPYSLVNM